MTTQTKSLEVSRFAVAAGNRILAAVVLVYFAPLMLAVALLIKMDSRGPVLQRQIRRGLNGETVSFWEFRTWAEADGSVSTSFGHRAKTTELGSFLRETRLDLLPRLVNMLCGEVSFGALLR